MNEEHHLDREKLVTVKVVNNEVEANIIKSLLETGGIRCVLVTPVPRGVYPFTVDGLADVKVNVLQTDAERARAIIGDYENSGALEDIQGSEPR